MSSELDTTPLLEAATAQMQALRDRPAIPVEISAEAAMVLISQLQLALRHPENRGASSDHARAFIAGLRSRIAAPGDPLDQLIGMGFEEKYDEEKDDEEKDDERIEGIEPAPHPQPARPNPGTKKAMTQEQMEAIGSLADTADNLTHAAILPMPAPFHVAQLCTGLAGIRDRLRALYVDVAGENPWEA